MPSVLAYHRPKSLDDASSLLGRSNVRIVGGGTVVVPDARVQRAHGVELVDLQALELDSITEQADGRLMLGAMVRLADLAGDDRVPTLLRDLATRELPSALRNQATVGGTVAQGAPDSLLVAGLLVHEATVQVHELGTLELADSLAGSLPRQIITSISVVTDGVGAVAATGRTPADDPIVAAVARRAAAGPRLALTGVGAVPLEVEPDNPVAALAPPGDFRGSSSYRIHLAATLAARVIAEVAP